MGLDGRTLLIRPATQNLAHHPASQARAALSLKLQPWRSESWAKAHHKVRNRGISAANELKSWLEALDPATEGAALVTTWKLVEEALNTSTWQASKSTLEVKEANWSEVRWMKMSKRSERWSSLTAMSRVPDHSCKYLRILSTARSREGRWCEWMVTGVEGRRMPKISQAERSAPRMKPKRRQNPRAAKEAGWQWAGQAKPNQLLETPSRRNSKESQKPKKAQPSALEN